MKRWLPFVVLACVVLVGALVFAQGLDTTLSFEIKPGKTFKQVALNRIEHFAWRSSVGNPQEDTYSTPVCDGKNIFIRGEEMLFCIGEK